MAVENYKANNTERVSKVIIRENLIKVEEICDEYRLKLEKSDLTEEDAIFFDLEHYVYKKPRCIGVFGAAYYDKDIKSIKVTQYMIENKDENFKLLILARDYFNKMKNELNKKSIITFSGNNDFTVIKYLFQKYNINFNFEENFRGIDIQREYEKVTKINIGLKNLEKQFDIERETELISGSNLAKTFSKVMKDKDYITRMPKEKVEKILLYNEQDVISLFYLYTNWYKYINKQVEKNKEEPTRRM